MVHCNRFDTIRGFFLNILQTLIIFLYYNTVISIFSLWWKHICQCKLCVFKGIWSREVPVWPFLKNSNQLSIDQFSKHFPLVAENLLTTWACIMFISIHYEVKRGNHAPVIQPQQCQSALYIVLVLTPLWECIHLLYPLEKWITC